MAWIKLAFARRKDEQASPRPSPTILPDAPIKASDEDKLRRVPFAKRIAAILSEPVSTDGRVFAIRGPWGNGKTSLKNLVIGELAAAHDTGFLDFNPWQWGDADSIAKALFKQIADKLGGKFSSAAAKRAKALRQYGALLTGAAEPLKSSKISAQALSNILTAGAVVTLAGAIGLALPSAALLAGVIGVVAIFLPLAGKLLLNLGQDPWSKPLDEVRIDLEERLRVLEQPLIIFVDDIDRLEPDQIRILVRQVKVNANLPNLTFVLLFQPSVVEAALDPISNAQGREFLEKIVQASFDLPAVAQSTVHRIFTEELGELAAAYASPENGFDQVRWGNALIGCIQPYIRNLRDARRLCSSIAIHLPLHAESGTFEVNIIDVLVLETMRVFEPEFHRALFEQRDLVLQSARFSTDGQDAANRQRAEALVDVVSATQQDTAKEIIRLLFPPVGWAFGASHYGHEWYSHWIAEKRVCTERFFPRYFELQTPNGEISESEFQQFIAAAGDQKSLAARIEDLKSRDLLGSLAGRLDEASTKLPVELARTLLPAMFRVAEHFAGQQALDPFSSPWVSAWRATSWYLDRVPKAERGQALLDALVETGCLSIAAILIHLKNPAEHQDESPRTVLLDLTVIEALKAEWLR